MTDTDIEYWEIVKHSIYNAIKEKNIMLREDEWDEIWQKAFRNGGKVYRPRRTNQIGGND